MFKYQTTMGVFVTVVVMGLIFFAGCNSSPVSEKDVIQTQSIKGPAQEIGPALLSTQLSSGRVDIMSYEIDSLNRTMTFQLNAFFDEYSPVRRVLTIDVNDDVNERPGFRSTLTDDRSELLWEFDMRMDPHQERHIWMTERSAEDVLTIEQLHTETSFTEVYTLNGTRKEFCFPTNDLDRITTVQDEIFSNGYHSYPESEKISATDRGIVETFVEFESFYDWENSLQANEEGFLVAEFITSEDVAEWLKTEFEESEIYLSDNWKLICATAAWVAAAKCPIPLNPACEVAVGVLGICVIVEILDRLF